MTILLAIADAARNCESHHTVAVITLKSGVQYKGKLKRDAAVSGGTVMIYTEGGGWATIDVEEIAAVESSYGTRST